MDMHGIKEKKAFAVGGVGAFAMLLLALLFFAAGIGGAVAAASADPGGSGFVSALPVIAILAGSVMFSGFDTVQPGHTKVVQFLGKYVGTVRQDGFIFSVPLTTRRKISVRVNNFETNELKINDFDGNPVNTAAIVVWQVTDTARASFAVEDYSAFIYTQSEAALRHVVSEHPYDEGNRTDVVSLRGSTDTVSDKLAQEVSARVAAAGITVVEARISSLAYAPEIAQAMLQRQQASAVVSARERIVEGAVSMVEDALSRLEQKSIVDLDDERRAAMVSNLLVVLCSDNHVSPVVNTGTLYN